MQDMNAEQQTISDTQTLEPTRPCERCKGKGIYVSSAFTSLEGRHYPETTHTCSGCQGKKEFGPIDVAAILQAITSSRGVKETGKRKFRAAWPSKQNHYTDHNMSRAYYVWRLSRFHGGADMTMPITADMVIRGDPFKAELNTLADQVARQVFGSDLHAAKRWGRALGLL